MTTTLVWPNPIPFRGYDGSLYKNVRGILITRPAVIQDMDRGDDRVARSEEREHFPHVKAADGGFLHISQTVFFLEGLRGRYVHIKRGMKEAGLLAGTDELLGIARCAIETGIHLPDIINGLLEMLQGKDLFCPGYPLELMNGSIKNGIAIYLNRMLGHTPDSALSDVPGGTLVPAAYRTDNESFASEHARLCQRGETSQDFGTFMFNRHSVHLGTTAHIETFSHNPLTIAAITTGYSSREKIEPMQIIWE